MHKAQDKYRPLFIYLILTAVPLLAFWQLHSCDFINYDDLLYVAENQHVLSGFTPENLIWTFNSGYASNWHPLTWLSHMLDCQLFGKNFGWHHMSSLLLHIAGTLLLFMVFKRMTSAIWQSAFVACLFAVHPLHVESVAWLSERKDVLNGLFWMLTMICYVRFVKRPTACNYLLTLFIFALGLATKPMLVTLPFVLLLLDYWPLSRVDFAGNKGIKKSKRIPISRLILEKVPFFVLSAISSVITFFAQRSLAVVKINTLSVTTRVSNAVISYMEYIEKMLWPTRLAVFYPYAVERLSLWRFAVAGLLLLFVTICVISLGRKYKYLPVGWFWYLGTLVPVIGLVHVGLQALADRYTYIPLTGLFIIIAWGIPELVKKWRYQKIVLAVLAVAILSALSICTWFQVGYWRNNVTLFEHALNVTDNNYLAYSLLAGSFLQQGKLDKALAYDSKALQIKPDHTPSHNNIGHTLFQMGKLDEAVVHFKQVLQLEPDFTEAQENLGKILSLQGKLEEAADCFRKALAVEPLDSGIHCQLGTVLGRQGKFNEAVLQFNEALRIKPDFAEAHGNLGYALLNQDKIDEAVGHLARAVQLDPNSDKAHYYFAVALGKKGRIADAVAQYFDTVRLKPDWIEPMDNLAWLLATYKNMSAYDPHKAVQLARRACELTGYHNAVTLDTLAAAYAADSNFPEAVTTAEKARDLAKSANNKQFAEQIQKRLDLYKINQPYIELMQKQTIK